MIFISCAARQNKPTVVQHEQFTLKAYPQMMIKPQDVTFFISGTRAASEVKCVAVEWVYGDGCHELIQDFSCSPLPNKWTKVHFYRSFGQFKPAVYLRDQETGKIIEWAETSLQIGALDEQ